MATLWRLPLDGRCLSVAGKCFPVPAICQPRLLHGGGRCSRPEVLDRILRTVRANLDCHARAVDRGIVDRFMPVIQGRTPEDYERCVEALGSLIRPGVIIGVGSMCRRPVTGREGLVAIIEHLDCILPKGQTIHAFGVKGTALPYLKPLSHRVASIDSQAMALPRAVTLTAVMSPRPTIWSPST